MNADNFFGVNKFYYFLQFATKISWLWWLSYGESFGLTDPLTLDLSILKISFALSFRINVASIIGLAFAMFWYYKI